MSEQEVKEEIKKEMLSWEVPFCIIDLYNRLSRKNLCNRTLALGVLGELYEKDLLDYTKTASGWMYEVK